jgi:Zn-dependent protease with chaperone function
MSLYLTIAGKTDTEINPPDDFKFKGKSFSEIIGGAVPLILSFAGIIIFLMFIFGGYTLLTSIGNPEGVKKGQHMIVNALIGFLIIFIAYWIMQALQIAFNLDLGFGN